MMRLYQAILLLFFFSYTNSLNVDNIQQIETSYNAKNSTIDPYAFLHIIRNNESSITRIKQFYPTVPPNTSSLAISKDIVLNPNKNTWVRIYLPKGSGSLPLEKLPIVVFVHGGGFIVLSAASPNYDNVCSYTANRLNSLVVSVNYRLSPENRLPAAYDDVLEALHWVKEGKDEWVKEFGDFSRCLVMGTSAGANSVYNVGLGGIGLVNGLKPLTLLGLVLVQPFFGGVNRTRSELRLIDDNVIPLAVTDLMWELSLPIGSDRNNVYCNPLIGCGSSKLEEIRKLGLKIAILGTGGDPLLDRQLEFTRLLLERGVEVKSSFTETGYHGIYNREVARIEEMLQFVRNVFFIGS